MIGAFDNSTIEFGIADHSPSHGASTRPSSQDSYKVHPRFTLELRPSLRAVHPVRSEGRPAHDVGAGRPVHSRAGRAQQASCSPAIPALPSRLTEQRSEQFRAAARRRVGRARRRADRHPRRLRHLLPADQRRDRRTRPRDRGAGRRSFAQGRIEDPFGSLGQTEPPPESPGRFGCSQIPEYPGLRCSLYPGADPDRLHRPESEDELYAPLQRLGCSASSTRNFVVEAAYVGKIGSKLVGHNYFNAAPFINSPITGQPPIAAERRAARAAQPRASSARSRACWATSSAARTTACSCGWSAGSPGASRSPARMPSRRT